MRLYFIALAPIFLSCGPKSIGYQCEEVHKARFLEECIENCSELNWCIQECEDIAWKRYCNKK